MIYTITDSHGLETVQNRTVIVQGAPVLTLVGANPQIVASGGTYTDLGATATDPEDGDITANIVVSGDTVDVNANASYNVVYTITDAGGLSDTDTRVVTVEDAPTMTMTGDNPLSVATGGVYTDPGVTVMDTEDGDITGSVVVSGDTVDPATAGTYNVIYTSTDSHGLETVQTRTVVVQGAPGLTITGANPQMVASGSTYTDLGATAMDPEDGDITANIVVSGDTVDTAINASYNVVYTITDSGGLSTTDTRVVTVEDAPVITMLGDNPLYVPSGGLYADPGATANDTEDGDITGNIIVGGDVVDPNIDGTYNVTYSVTDSHGIQTMETRPVIVQNPPVLTMLGNNPLIVETATAYVDPGATATDVEDGNITANIVVSGDTVDPNTAGNYNVIYTITDSAGVVVSDTRIVTVSDAPVVTVLGDSPLGIITGGTYTDPGATANDTEDGNITANIVVSGDTVDPATPGTYTVIYTVTDSHGLVGSKTRDVGVSDAPVLTITGANPMMAPNGTAWVDPGATATDTEDGNITANIIVSGDTVDVNVNGNYNVIYTVTDTTGLSATDTRLVTISDAPVLTLLGSNPMEIPLNGTYTDPGATANDVQDGDITVNIVLSGDTVDPNTAGAYNVIYTITDADGFVDTETRIVNVANYPVVTIVGDNPTEVIITQSYTELGATATDVEDGNLDASVVIGGDTVLTNTYGAYNVTYTVTDADGHTTVETRVVNVTGAPLITLIANQVISVVVGNVPPAATYSAFDHEDGDLTANVVLSGDTLDINTIGTYRTDYDVTDSDGNPAGQRHTYVHMVANTLPVITLSDDVNSNTTPITLVKNEAWVDPGATANDFNDGDITGSIIVTGDTLDVSTLGTYNIIHDVSDSDGGAAPTITRVITVVTGDSPVVTITGANPMTVPLGGTYTELGATANDTEDGDISGSVIVGGDTVDPNNAATYNVTYTSTDSSDNVTTETRVVTVSL